MTPEQLAKSIWVKHHMARLLSRRSQQLGNRREDRARISNQIGRLMQQARTMQSRLDALAGGAGEE